MANTINIGNIEASAIMIGSSAVSAVYIGSDKIYPSGPPDYSRKYLTFEVVEPGTVTITASNSNIAKTIQYSLDNGSTWTSLTASTTEQSLGGTLSAGDKVLVKGTNGSYGTSNNYRNAFGGSAKTKVYGNVMSLISGDNFASSKTLSVSYAFKNLFRQYTNLLSADNLVLPATTLTNSCYSYMFYGCTSLTTVPALPATTLAQRCYYYMFQNCTSLTTAPELPATTLANYCYQGMFSDCTSLNYIKCLATDISATNCTSSWLYRVPSGGTFVKNTSMSDWTTGTSGIPSGWTVQNDGAQTDNWVLVDDWGIQSPRKIKVDYSLIVDTEDVQEDYNFNSYDLGSYSIFYINERTGTFLVENYGIDEDFIMEHFQKVVVFNINNGGITDVLEDGVEYSSINGYSLTDFSVKALNENRYLYATE